MNIKKREALHYELWNWCSDNPDKRKWNWPRFQSNGGDIPNPISNCFLCEALTGCEACGEEYNISFEKLSSEGCLGGLYGDYLRAKTPAAITLAAIAIRDVTMCNSTK